MKAREEKGELAANVAKLEAMLKDAKAAAQPAPSSKVMLTICFSKFKLQKFVALSLTDTIIRWSRFGNFADYENHSLPGVCRRRQSAGVDRGKHISLRRSSHGNFRWNY